MAFGITDNIDIDVRNDCFENMGSHNYCALHPMHCKSRGVLMNYPFRIAEGAVMKMILNLKRRELSFYLDGIACGVAFDDIECDKDIYYKMAISFFSPGSVELLHYNVK